MPTGFKNSTDGSIGIAIDACRAAKSGHVFLSVGKEGLSSIIETTVRIFIFLRERRPCLDVFVNLGHPDVHVILRGGSSGPNYSAEFVREAGAKLAKAGLAQKVMVSDCLLSLSGCVKNYWQIDCSHGNSSKQHAKQIEVAEDIVSFFLIGLGFSLDREINLDSPT